MPHWKYTGVIECHIGSTRVSVSAPLEAHGCQWVPHWKYTGVSGCHTGSTLVSVSATLEVEYTQFTKILPSAFL